MSEYVCPVHKDAECLCDAPAENESSAQIAALTAERDAARAEVERLTALFDNDSPDAVNALAAQIKRAFDATRYDNLCRALSRKHCEYDTLRADLDRAVEALVEAVKAGVVWHCLGCDKYHPVGVTCGCGDFVPNKAVKVLAALLDKLDAIGKAQASVFQMAAIHGCPYTGPTWVDEYADARATLASLSTVTAPDGQEEMP